MLKCRDIAHYSSDYLEGNLSLGQRMGVTMHIFMCNKCRTFVRHLRLALAYYGQLPMPPLDDAETSVLVDRILVRCAERSG